MVKRSSGSMHPIPTESSHLTLGSLDGFDVAELKYLEVDK